MDGSAQLPLDTPPAEAALSSRPMIIDSFAGGGGASTAIEIALGRSPDVAINHNAAALAMHAANHPETDHLITPISAIDPREVVKPGQRVGLAWFSPDCKHFSKARGGTPVSKNIRDLAWVVVHWAERVRPEIIMLENVEEFLTWGPLRHRHVAPPDTTWSPASAEDWEAAPAELKGTPTYDAHGNPIIEPDPLRKGQTFNEFVRRLKKLGYAVEWRELRACDYGAPTIRKRLFMVMRCDGRPIAWPEPTHGDPTSEAVKSGALEPWRTAAECIDWSLPCPSIFASKEEIKARHGLNAIRPLKPATMKRIARGMKRYVLDADRPFVVNLTHGGRVEDLADPFRTITSANRGEKAVVAPSITRFNGGATGQDMRAPLATVTANSWIKKPGGASPLGLLAPHLMTMRNAQKPFNGADEPTHTITAGGAGLSLVAPSLVSVAHGYSGGRREYPITDTHGVVTAGGISHAVTAAFLASLKGSDRRARTIQEPHPSVLAGGGHSAVLAATMVQTGYGERTGQAPRALDLGRPLGTVVAGAVKHALVTSTLIGCGGRAGQSRPRAAEEPLATVTAKADGCIAAAFLAQHHTTRHGAHPGRAADVPLSTIAATGGHQMPVAAWMAKYYGTDQNPELGSPLHTVTSRDRFGHMQACLAAPHFSEEHQDRAREVADFLREHGYWDDREFVTHEIDGETFVVVDIGMRMLVPRELFNAQGFPPDYVIEGHWTENGEGEWDFHPFTKNVQVSGCGNSVSPPPATALLKANCAHMAETS